MQVNILKLSVICLIQMRTRGVRYCVPLLFTAQRPMLQLIKMLNFKKILKLLLNKKPRDNLSYKESHRFGYKDVVRSVIAKKYKIDNHPKNLEFYHNIGHTNYRITAILEALLKYYNKTWKDVVITSWFRSLKLNRLLVKLFKASKTSEHMEGKAIDFKIKGISPKEICNFINKNLFAYNQLIQEPSWTHISFDSSPYLEKNEFLVKIKGGYKNG